MNSIVSINAPAQARAEDRKIRSKVVVVEHDKDKLGGLKQFIESCNLDGYQASKNTVSSVLKRNVDLGAIFLPYAAGHESDDMELALAIHMSRSDLPIFLRVDSHEVANDIPAELRNAVAGVYVHCEFERLKELVDTFLFNRHYPNAFVAGVKEFTLNAFQAAFKGLHVEADPPYIVKDKIIYGELFSLLPLESVWCRGYMTLQSEEDSVREAIAARKTQMHAIEPNFHHVNELLAELANMIRGGFKARYGSGAVDLLGNVRVEVPIIINHAHRYISFGADAPQLCFKVTLTDPDGKLRPVVMYEKFIFNLDWSPEKYAESNQNVNEMVSSGELELF